MRKMSIVRFAASAALLGSVGLGMAVTLPAGIAGAAKGPVTGSCSLLLGDATDQIATGCTGGKSTPDAVSQPNSGDTGATITFLNKKTVTENFTYTSVTDTCSTYGGASPSLEEQENATVTGGTAKFTAEAVPSSDVCVYIDGSNGSILIVGPTGISL
jgi:hypothetical protein